VENSTKSGKIVVREGPYHENNHRDPILQVFDLDASWLNQVQIWFNRISQQAIRRGTFRDTATCGKKS
jgi:hypothetical protein